MEHEGTRRRIVDVAMEMCQQAGVHSISFREIGSRVGIRSASVHHHFPTKSDLLIALVKQYQDGFKATLDQISASGKTPVHQLSAFLNVLEDCLVAKNRCCLCTVLAVESDSVCCTTQFEVNNFFDIATGWLAELLQSGRSEKELNFTDDPKVVAETFMASMNGIVIAAKRHGGVQAFKRMTGWWLAMLGASAVLSVN